MQTSISLASLVSPWVENLDESLLEYSISRLVLDSRQVQVGDTFVAIIGHTIDGRHFIERAIEQGANLVIAEADHKHLHGTCEVNHRVPVLYIQALGTLLSDMAGRLYRHDAMKLIGVTGTNGKTTITQLLAQWIELLGERAAVMGTTGNGFLGALQSAKNTTGSAIDIQATLAELAQKDARYAALEVSSHGLVQDRVKALSFSAGVFTNLSRDHLDYHGTMEAYALAKKQLFTTHQCQNAILNVDDPVGQIWSEELENVVAVSLVTQPTSLGRSVWATRVDYSKQGITLAFDGHWGTGELTAGLIGQFNASNLLLAFTTLLSLGFEKRALIETAPDLVPVIGRMELFCVNDKAHVVVDYAHTPDALDKALAALRVHCHGKLWVIVGCGGDRDPGKRPIMAEIAEKGADNVILTDDNPRTEDPQSIIQAMLLGLTEPESVTIRHDREDALNFALTHAQAEDIILMAGKGHEDYQIFADKTVHFSDRETAQRLLGMIE